MRRGIRRTLFAIVTLLCATCLFACGEKEKDTNTKPEKKKEVNISKPETVNASSGSMKELGNQVTAMIESLQKKQDELEKKVGSTFESYQTNKNEIDMFYSAVLSDSQACFDQLAKDSLEYFKKIYTDYANDEDKLEAAVDNYYDFIYDGVLDDYYDKVYDGILDDIYDNYYDGIIDEAYDTLDYSQWEKVSSEAYKSWSEASSGVYKIWNNASSGYYGMWSEASSQLWDENKDVETLLSKMQEAYAKSQQEQEKAEVKPSGAIDGVRPEFKEALDSYEKFIDEYVAFLKKYKESTDVVSMMNDYTSYMTKYLDTMTKIKELNSGNLSKEETLYYLEVVNRINQKLADAM